MSDLKTIKERIMIKKRGLLSFILLSVITGGIYGLFRIYVLARDVNIMCAGDGKKTGGLLAYIFLGMITIGIYPLVWLYKIGNRLQANGPKYNLTIQDSGGTIIMWSIFGSLLFGIGPFVAMYKIFKNTNALADEYNKKQA
jgi:hypothetical protein